MQQMQAMPPEAQAPVAPPVPPGPGVGPMGEMVAPPEEKKKPPLLLPPRLAKQLARAYVDSAREMAQKISDITGPPDEFERYSTKEQVKAWYKRDIRQDPYALREEGKSDVEIRDAVYPLRRILLKMIGPSPTERAKFAARMKAERAKADTIEGETSS